MADTVTLAAAACLSNQLRLKNQEQAESKKLQNASRKPARGDRSIRLRYHPICCPIAACGFNTIGYGGISRSNARMIRTGQVRPTARIDLHDRPVMSEIKA